jgi:hypothetical protein
VKIKRSLIVTLLFCAVSFPVHAYKIKIDLSMPKSSAGGTPAATEPVSTKISPCSDPLKPDVLQVSITYDALGKTKSTDRDVYLIFYNPENYPRYLLVSKPTIAVNNRIFSSYADIYTLDSPEARETAYLPREFNTSGSGTEVLLGSTIGIDGVLAGTWQIIGVIADRKSAKFSFDDNTTWDAWDVATVMFGRPWVGKNPGRTCQ